MAGPAEKRVFSPGEVNSAIQEMSKSIVSDCPSPKDLVFIGIATGGVPLSKRLAAQVQSALKVAPKLGILDITFYRDDIALRQRAPVIKRTEIPFSLDDQYVVLVDDVLFSGRTVRAAMDALVDFGRPRVVRLAVLVDRGHRELPIHADFAGFAVKTEKQDQVRVTWKELGQDDDAVNLVKEAA